jgi:predicted TIM-barrel fold metal-dependent hydrolase
MGEMSEVTKAAAQNPFHGQMLDADGHLYLTPEDMLEFTREIGEPPFIDFYSRFYQSDEYRAQRDKRRSHLWEIKGLPALGAYDFAERLEALDAMGIRAQLLFPNSASMELRINSEAARKTCVVYNTRGNEMTRNSKGRIRVAAQINMHDVDWATREVERVIRDGSQCVTLSCNAPPAGVSPSHSKWDRFWAILQEADIPATLHLGAAGLISSRRHGDFMFPEFGWGESETLRKRPAERGGGEEAISPWFMIVAHVGTEIFLESMIMGKVFDRFPRLRFGIIECSAEWVGFAAERMDSWVDFMMKVGVKYDTKPSDVLKRNVRVTPFWHEDLKRMIDRFGLPECWVFSTDYPHLEGSKDPIGKFRRQLEALPPEYAHDFFVRNNELLFPNL